MSGAEVTEILNALSDPAQSVMRALVWRTLVDGATGMLFGAAMLFGAWKLWCLDFGERLSAENDQGSARFLALVIAFIGALCICISVPALLAPEGQAIHNLFNK